MRCIYRVDLLEVLHASTTFSGSSAASTSSSADCGRQQTDSVKTQPSLLVKNQCCHISSPTNIPLGQGSEAVVDEEPLVKEFPTNGAPTGLTTISSCSSLLLLPGFPSAHNAALRVQSWTRNIPSPSLGPACDQTTPYCSLQD